VLALVGFQLAMDAVKLRGRSGKPSACPAPPSAAIAAHTPNALAPGLPTTFTVVSIKLAA
jgi:hypothetical protein